MTLRLLADDLTGALDAGACFVGRCGPLTVTWDETRAGGDLVIDSETRDAPPDAAAERVMTLLAQLAGATMLFKKIDSLMRGNTIRELKACCESPLFASVVVAPAFPAQRRVTRGAWQLARDRDGAAWEAVGPKLDEALRRADRPLHSLDPSATGRGEGIFVCDAESEADLSSLPDRLMNVARPILWCGTAGLARALAGGVAPARVPDADRIVAIIGSDHAVTRCQVERLAAVGAVIRIVTEGDVDRIARTLDDAVDQPLVLVLTIDREAVGGPINHRLAFLIDRLLRTMPAPDLFLATGGDTLMGVLRAVGAEAAIVDGEAAPGIPRGRVKGGRWDGCAFLSKSGAFGTADTLVDLFRAARRRVPA